VLPGGAGAYLSPDPRGFRSRAASPKGGEGLLVLQAPRELLAGGGGGAWVVRNAAGTEVGTTNL
jgi:hypothetical protein